METTISIPSNDLDYPTITIDSTNIIEITSVVEDGTNDKWYEVPYLGQEMVFLENPNTSINGMLSQYSGSVPYLLELKKVPKRFSVKVNTDSTFNL